MLGLVKKEAAVMSTFALPGEGAEVGKNTDTERDVKTTGA